MPGLEKGRYLAFVEAWLFSDRRKWRRLRGAAFLICGNNMRKHDTLASNLLALLALDSREFIRELIRG